LNLLERYIVRLNEQHKYLSLREINDRLILSDNQVDRARCEELTSDLGDRLEALKNDPVSRAQWLQDRDNLFALLKCEIERLVKSADFHLVDSYRRMCLTAAAADLNLQNKVVYDIQYDV
jgi:hypothetical protein